MMDDKIEEIACRTPLVELLERVPADARMTYEHHSTHHQMIPVGRLCHEAAEAIRAYEVMTRSDGEVARALGNNDDLPKQLLLDADEMEACGAGNEAANMRELVKRLLDARAALTQSSVQPD